MRRVMRLRVSLPVLNEELKAKDGTVEADESSGDGERKKRKRAEDFGKFSRYRQISDSG